MSYIPHTIEVDDVEQMFKTSEWQWHTFASSAGTVNKRFQIAIGAKVFRVLDKQEIVYEGTNIHDAVKAFNIIY